MSKSKSKAAAQLVHSQEINHFRENFRKVFLALQKSSKDNKQLIRKCRLLGRQLSETGTKLYQLLEIKQKDEGLIQNLRFKLKEAWMTSETYRSRESAANGLVKQMKGELEKLKAEVNRLHLDNKELKMQLSQQSSTAFFASKGARQTWGGVSRPKTSAGAVRGRTLDRRASTGNQDSQLNGQRNDLSISAVRSLVLSVHVCQELFLYACFSGTSCPAQIPLH